MELFLYFTSVSSFSFFSTVFKVSSLVGVILISFESFFNRIGVVVSRFVGKYVFISPVLFSYAYPSRFSLSLTSTNDGS